MSASTFGSCFLYFPLIYMDHGDRSMRHWHEHKGGGLYLILDRQVWCTMWVIWGQLWTIICSAFVRLRLLAPEVISVAKQPQLALATSVVHNFHKICLVTSALSNQIFIGKYGVFCFAALCSNISLCRFIKYLYRLYAKCRGTHAKCRGITARSLRMDCHVCS